MTPKDSKELFQKIIEKENWSDVFSHFVDVLRINIFIIDHESRIILFPKQERYGAGIFLNTSLRGDLLEEKIRFLSRFSQKGKYLEYRDSFDLHTFAIPIKVEHETPFAYIILGPVILNRRLKTDEYHRLAVQQNVNPTKLINEVNEVRVVSHIMINSILDLVTDIVEKNIVKGILEEEAHTQSMFSKVLTRSFHKRNKKTEVSLEQLMNSLLDVALKMTQTDAGSVMIKDEETGDLVIMASKGLDTHLSKSTRLKMGEGIAGIAAQEEIPFMISGTEADNRIKHLLKRPDIKESFVMPFRDTNDHVLGVLNINSSKDYNRIKDNIENLEHLFSFLSTT